jgi:hypothetical protein
VKPVEGQNGKLKFEAETADPETVKGIKEFVLNMRVMNVQARSPGGFGDLWWIKLQFAENSDGTGKVNSIFVTFGAIDTESASGTYDPNEYYLKKLSKLIYSTQRSSWKFLDDKVQPW